MPACSVQTEKPTQLPLLFHPCIDNGRREEGRKKSMLSNAEIGKCHFDKCKALCTHRLNFDGFLPRRGLLFLFIGLHIKMLNNDVTESKYKCHWHKSPPMNSQFFVCVKYFSFKDRQPFEGFLKAYVAIFRKMLHKTCILIWPVTGHLHGEINANEFALVQTEV